ncbi:MAG TPA: TetR/AcrR family transcriptional regulator [Candidatus Binatia bacterium]|nr:TetR/AcrR family transcriptional regulator [Candidatus Binatia bacterium]
MRTRASRAEQVGRNRSAVLLAARRVFLARGYAGATLDGIAEEAGFSKGVVYSQFASKADLFMALLEERIGERAAENERIVADVAGAAGLHALLRNFEADSRAEAGWARLLVEFRTVALRDPELSRRYARAHARTVELLAGMLGQLHARAGLRPAVPPRTMAELILALGAGVTLERAADPDALPSAALTEMVLSGLGFAPVRERVATRLRKVAR